MVLSITIFGIRAVALDRLISETNKSILFELDMLLVCESRATTHQEKIFSLMMKHKEMLSPVGFLYLLALRSCIYAHIFR